MNLSIIFFALFLLPNANGRREDDEPLSWCQASTSATHHETLQPAEQNWDAPLDTEQSETKLSEPSSGSAMTTQCVIINPSTADKDTLESKKSPDMHSKPSFSLVILVEVSEPH